MQKSSQKGSILIWSIGISLILVFLFASFSTRLSEKIRFEKGLVGGVKNIFQADSFNTLSGAENNVSITQIESNFESLQEGEKKEYRVRSTSSISVTIVLDKGGPIAFKFVAFSGETLMGGASSSGFIDTSASFTGFLNANYDNGLLYIKNLGGYSSYSLTGSKEFIPQTRKYTISKETAGENQTQRELLKPQFTNGEWGDLDYEKLGIDF